MSAAHFETINFTVLLHLPLKQGLKPELIRFFPIIRLRSFTSSIKTRIETPWSIRSGNWFELCSFTSSIKTRIETLSMLLEPSPSTLVLLHLPLKQGLKLCQKFALLTFSLGSFTSSIKTRIETFSLAYFIAIFGFGSFTSSIKTRIETHISV